jgi:hypothetical protein
MGLQVEHSRLVISQVCEKPRQVELHSAPKINESLVEWVYLHNSSTELSFLNALLFQ